MKERDEFVWSMVSAKGNHHLASMVLQYTYLHHYLHPQQVSVEYYSTFTDVVGYESKGD